MRNFYDTRIGLFLFVLVAITGLIVYRLFDLTYLSHSAYVQSAKSQYNNPSAMLEGRGNIYFSNLSSGGSAQPVETSKKIVATNQLSYYAYTNNLLEMPIQEIVGRVGSILKKDSIFLENLLTERNRNYQIIGQNLTKDQADKIKALKINGLNVALEIRRFYNNGPMAATVLGFVGFNGNQRVGQYGVESYYDEHLSGAKKTESFLGNKSYSDLFKVLQFWKKPELEDFVEAETEFQDGSPRFEDEAGSDLVLTLDQNIQSMVEVKLDAVLKKWDASAGSIIVEDPNSGAILAMASSPSFDPNNYSGYELKFFLNPNIQEIFEPGSSFKPITMAAAIDSGAVTPETTYNDTGEVKVSGYTIRNFDERASGIQTMRQVLERSLNTGAIFAQEKMGDDTFLNYVVGFGFGQKAGIDSTGEVSGSIANLYSGRKINFLTASFGQGVAVTPLQLINAYSAIANGGKLMRPYLVQKIIRPDGSAVVTKPKVIRAPITEKTSLMLKSMLVDVVDKGFDKARITGYDVAGKTGTAQIADPSGGGYLGDDQFIHDFVGFAPAYSPKFVVLIKIEKPKGIKFASDSLSPVFGDIVRYLLRYFNVPPTRQ